MPQPHGPVSPTGDLRRKLHKPTKTQRKISSLGPSRRVVDVSPRGGSALGRVSKVDRHFSRSFVISYARGVVSLDSMLTEHDPSPRHQQSCQIRTRTKRVKKGRENRSQYKTRSKLGREGFQTVLTDFFDQITKISCSAMVTSRAIGNNQSDIKSN
jgi:hypothetical protein